MRRTCEDCARAREGPGWPMFNPACLWCGARLIQRIRALKGVRPREELVARVAAAKSSWLSYGHSEKALGELVAQKKLPLAPDGQDESGACADPTPTKPRSARPRPASSSAQRS